MSIDSHLRDFDYQYEESKLLKEDHYVTIQSVMNFTKGQEVMYGKLKGIVSEVSITKRRVIVQLNKGFKELKPSELEILGDRYYQHWTVSDLNFIRENRHDMTSEQMAVKMGRPELAIINFKKANNL